MASKVGKQAKSKCVQSLSLSQSFSYSMPSMGIPTKSFKVESKASRGSSGKLSKSSSHGDGTGLVGSSISSKTSKCVEPSVHSPSPIVTRDDTTSVLSTTNGTRIDVLQNDFTNPPGQQLIMKEIIMDPSSGTFVLTEDKTVVIYSPPSDQLFIGLTEFE